MALSAQPADGHARDHRAGGQRPDQRRAQPGHGRSARPRCSPSSPARAARRPERSLLQGLERDRPLIERGVQHPHAVSAHGPLQPERLAYVDQFARRQGGVPDDRRAGRAPHHLRRDRRLHPRARRPAGRSGTAAPRPRRATSSRSSNSLWSRAVPLSAGAPYETAPDGITDIQHSIAKLLIEGHVDEAIARRLGMNVRTCRAHIAKLATALGSGSRAQLGFLIAQSGILDQDR